MARMPASIVILAWNAWAETQACLESLRPTLGVNDEVIVVDNGSTDGTGARLGAYPWLRVLSNAENRGFAGGCNQGAAAASRDVLVFLNNDTVLTGHWLDALVSPLRDPGVGAVGPRSNFVSGPQLVEGATYRNDDRRAMRHFAREWAASHQGHVSPVQRLVGFCLAVRRGAFEQIGGFDEGFAIGGFEDDDLCARLDEAGWSLLIAHESFVHHAGHRTFDANGVDWLVQQNQNQQRFEEKHRRRASVSGPLVSACLVVPEGSKGLETSLLSLSGVADEVVVLDRDHDAATRALATRHGAIYVATCDETAEPSAARNAAGEAARGAWLLWLDPGESFACDHVAGLRSLLQRASPAVDGIGVPVETAGVFPGERLLRREHRLSRRGVARWHGALCEELVRAPHGGPLFALTVDDLRIVRPPAAARGREPGREDAAPGSRDTAGLARALLLAGRPADALATAGRALAQTADPAVARHALRTTFEAALALGSHPEARRALDDLRARSTSPVLPNRLAALLHSAAGDHLGALALLAEVAPGADDDGFHHGAGELALLRANALAALGKLDDAADTLLEVVERGDTSATVVASLLESLHRSGRSPAELLAVVHEDGHRSVLAQSFFLASHHADRLLEAALAHPTVPTALVLDAAADVAPRLPLDAAQRWSKVLRGHGRSEACPLVAIAADARRSASEATRAAAEGYAAFGDERLAGAFPVRFALASPPERAEILVDTSARCPELVTGRGRHERADGLRPPGSAEPLAPVSIIIPCFNKSDYTLRCLASLQAHTAPGSYQVVIVDNGSTDATSRLSSAEDHSFLVVRNEENLGFARACNQGAAAATSDVLLFLNNDTEALPGWLPPLVDELSRHPEVGIVGSRLLYPDGTLQHAGVAVGPSDDGTGGFDGYHRFHRAPGAYAPALRRERLRVVTGAALAVRASLFAALGGFDEGYWNGNEDVDLCLRAGELGWQVVYEPASCLVHHESVSGPERFSKVGVNRTRLARRWAGRVIPDLEGHDSGVNVLASFAGGDPDSELARRLVTILEERGVPATTTELRPSIAPGGPADGFVHRLGPAQRRTVLVVPSTPPLLEPAATEEWCADRRLGVFLGPKEAMAEWQRAMVADATDLVASPGPQPDVLERILGLLAADTVAASTIPPEAGPGAPVSLKPIRGCAVKAG